MFRCLLAAALLVVTGCTQIQNVHADDPASTEAGEQEFAVLELFTSQGCSSCPPADALLQKLQEGDKQVFALSFHVDYWNRLGWKDPYSQKAFSDRQRAYARLRSSNRVYTPQLIVNGKHAFVGSDQKQAGYHLTNSTAKPSQAIKLRATRQSAANLNIGYTVTGNGDNRLLNIAVVETVAGNKVPHGENAGRRLQHVNVVRVFRTFDLSKAAQGVVKCELPAEMQKQPFRVIAFSQDRKTGQVTGVGRIEAEDLQLTGKP